MDREGIPVEIEFDFRNSGEPIQGRFDRVRSAKSGGTTAALHHAAHDERNRSHYRFSRRKLSMTKGATTRDIPDDGGEKAFPKTIGDAAVEWATMTLPSTCGQHKDFLTDEIEEAE